jgi:carboxyl-terminal processing protease
MPKAAKIALLTFVGVVVVALLLAAGFFLGMSPEFGGKLQDILPSGCATSSTLVDEKLQEEVLQKLEANYYKEIDPAKLQRGAIDGMVASLNDRWTEYLDAQEYSDLQTSLSHSYSGVGMTMELVDGLVVIVSTFEGSPAALAGIKAGDILVSVDGISTDGLKIDQVATRVRGPEGTTVKVSMYRPPIPSTTTTAPGESSSGPVDQSTTTTAGVVDSSHLPAGGTSMEYTLTRKTIAVPVTHTEVVQDGAKKVAHIYFSSFSEGSAQALRAEVKQVMEVDKVDAIILDLRSNGGGLIQEAVGVASIFIQNGTIVSTEGLHSPQEVLGATGGAYSTVPLYVLTDKYTASASEIVSGALQDYKRATLVGETTFGKGLVQLIVPLSNGGALKVTIAVYLTPKGRDINQKGITPDMVAPDDLATPDVDETLQEALDLIAGTAVAP